jgi:hypothetical protein
MSTFISGQTYQYKSAFGLQKFDSIVCIFELVQYCTVPGTNSKSFSLLAHRPPAGYDDDRISKSANDEGSHHS